ncbi:late embryogenesis abundant protein isoform X1 [Gossypium australe]|uniref:Late embryogenesis abundant protein isoform X1 n=1 Tax=Gossypium australe TaxID=47621 RepID=A0A5B6UKT0_9ROSI|nr:late embryogenesis abundant protein isoform X1 [Gossypium australe]
MQEDPQAKSLEPIDDYPRSDMVFGWIEPKQDKKSSKCLVYILAIMVIQGFILLVLANIFLRARTPDFEIGSVKVRNLKYGNSSAPSFNFTLVTQVTVENTNFGEFRFDKSTGTVWCGSEVVGLMKIPKGIAQARATEKMKVSINVSSLWLSDAKNLRRNMSYGLLEFKSYVKLSGRVNILNIVRRRRNPEMNCFMKLNLSGKTIQGLKCD